MIYKILISRSVQTPNSDKKLANLLPIANVCLQHKSTFGVHYRTGSPGQLGLQVAGFPGHRVARSQNVTEFHVWFECGLCAVHVRCCPSAAWSTTSTSLCPPTATAHWPSDAASATSTCSSRAKTPPTTWKTTSRRRANPSAIWSSYRQAYYTVRQKK